MGNLFLIDEKYMKTTTENVFKGYNSNKRVHTLGKFRKLDFVCSEKGPGLTNTSFLRPTQFQYNNQ